MRLVPAMKLGASPKGFPLRLTDQEIVDHYLRLKINGLDLIPEVDACKWEPWDLPALSLIKSNDHEWLFLCPRDRKYPNGNHRSNRATEAGYWKAIGKDCAIKSLKSCGCSDFGSIFMKKTLVFHKGHPPKCERTNWIMHEYHTTEQGDYVLCRLFHKACDKIDHLKTTMEVYEPSREVSMSEGDTYNEFDGDFIYNANDRILLHHTENMAQAQGQISPSLFQAAQSTAYSSIGSGSKLIRRFYCCNPDNTPVSETGIKIRTRVPRERPLRYVQQGTAPRRLHLVMPNTENNSKRSASRGSSYTRTYAVSALITGLIVLLSFVFLVMWLNPSSRALHR